MRSQELIDKEILSILKGKPLDIYKECIKSPFFLIAQKHSNLVSKQRLNMNDHGPVHMRKVTLYALQISQLLKNKNIVLSGQSEGWCDYGDSLSAIILSSFTHDFGMGINRDNHEFFTLLLAINEIERILNIVYPNELKKVYGMKNMIIESISGHMGNQNIASLEAGILMVADGCDLEFGRAKTLKNFNIKGKIGDIHSYSASCIKKITISGGEIKAIKIKVEMEESGGFFQIEEILMQKVLKSTIREHVEIIAYITNEIPKKYL
jgi:hypothetical protein